MFSSISPLVALVLAILDYLFKAIVSYRETDEGRAEWLDIVAAYEQVTGDVIGEETARAQADTSREVQRVRNIPANRRVPQTRETE